MARFCSLLACALAVACAGCGGGKPTREESVQRYVAGLREAVTSKVEDPQRRSQMLQVVDRIEALHVRFNRETGDFIVAFRRLNADYDAGRPAFDQLFADYRAQRIEARGEALDLHSGLAALATDAEWKAIGKAEAKLYEKTVEARPAGKTAE
jgi:hypothetical protein